MSNTQVVLQQDKDDIASTTQAFNLFTNIKQFINKYGGNKNINGKNRDYYKEYDYLQEVGYEESYKLYTRLTYAKRLVDLYPDTIWSHPPTFRSDSVLSELINGKFNDKDELVEEGLAQTHNIYNALNKADKLSKIGKFSILVIGINDGKKLDQPVLVDTNSSSSTELLFLRAYGFGDVTIKKLVDSPNSPDFGKPMIYTIKMNDNEVDVHYSRVLHVVDTELDNSIYGIPLMEVLNNTFRDFIKVSGGASEIFFLNSRKGLIVPIEGLANLDESTKKAIDDKVKQFHNGMERTLLVDGVEPKELGSDDINPAPVIDTLIAQMCSVGKVPTSVLIGSTPSSSSSEQDRAIMASNIKNEQITRCENDILRIFINKLQNLGVLPDEIYELAWPDTFVLSPLEKTKVAAQQSRSFLSCATAVTLTGDSILNGNEIHHVIAAGDAAIETTRDITVKIIKQDLNNVNANVGDGLDNSETTNDAISEQTPTDKID